MEGTQRGSGQRTELTAGEVSPGQCGLALSEWVTSQAGPWVKLQPHRGCRSEVAPLHRCREEPARLGVTAHTASQDSPRSLPQVPG